MALVGYGSSDDEEDETLETGQQILPDQPVGNTEADEIPDDNNSKSNISHIQTKEGDSSQNEQPSPSSPSQQQHQVSGQNASTQAQAPAASHPEAEAEAAPAPIGPQLGPSATPEAQLLSGHLAGPSFPPLEDAEDGGGGGGGGGGTGPQPSSSLPQPQPQQLQPAPGSSPYTAHRTTLRDLTLPTVPNMDIPPSPPPEQIAHPEAHQKTTAKFEQFLALKKQGVHFNSKIAASSALRNPALADKLMGFVDVDHRAQYATSTLPPEIWDPAAFPRWSYKEQLRQSQTDVAAGRARGKGAPVAFVPSSVAAGASAGQDVSDSQGKRKTRFDA